MGTRRGAGCGCGEGLFVGIKFASEQPSFTDPAPLLGSDRRSLAPYRLRRALPVHPATSGQRAPCSTGASCPLGGCGIRCGWAGSDQPRTPVDPSSASRCLLLGSGWPTPFGNGRRPGARNYGRPYEGPANCQRCVDGRPFPCPQPGRWSGWEGLPGRDVISAGHFSSMRL